MSNVLTFGRLFARTVATGLQCRLLSLESPQPSCSSPSPASRHQFITAASGFPKDMLFGPSTVHRRDGFGDDACFVASHQDGDVIGVADGVGGWRSYGIDPSKFSRTLMSTCERLVREGKFNPQAPAHLIAASYRELKESSINANEPMMGSSTACVVMLDRDSNRVHTANLGDSGFMVMRRGRVVHRSHEQQHYFNTPFQLSLPLPDDSQDFLSDSPDCAETTSFEVQEGDLILLATDGLFDNMPTHLIQRELANLDEFDESSIQATCNSIALQARRLAFDQEHMSPFAQKAKEFGIDAKGGKPDDITIILAVVTSMAGEDSNATTNSSADTPSSSS